MSAHTEQLQILTAKHVVVVVRCADGNLLEIPLSATKADCCSEYGTQMINNSQ